VLHRLPWTGAPSALNLDPPYLAVLLAIWASDRAGLEYYACHVQSVTDGHRASNPRPWVRADEFPKVLARLMALGTMGRRSTVQTTRSAAPCTSQAARLLRRGARQAGATCRVDRGTVGTFPCVRAPAFWRPGLVRLACQTALASKHWHASRYILKREVWRRRILGVLGFRFARMSGPRATRCNGVIDSTIRSSTTRRDKPGRLAVAMAKVPLRGRLLYASVSRFRRNRSCCQAAQSPRGRTQQSHPHRSPGENDETY